MIQRNAASMTLNKTYVRDAFLLNTACLERKQQLFTSAQCVQDDVTRLKKKQKKKNNSNANTLATVPRDMYKYHSFHLGATTEKLTSVKNCTMHMRWSSVEVALTLPFMT